MREFFYLEGPSGVFSEAISRKISFLPYWISDYAIYEGDKTYFLQSFPTANVDKTLGLDTGSSASPWWGDGFRLSDEELSFGNFVPELGPPGPVGAQGDLSGDLPFQVQTLGMFIAFRVWTSLAKVRLDSA